MKNKKCEDKNCIIHGKILPRGITFTGTVVGTNMQKTASVEWSWKRKIPKYERYEIKITKVKAHNSPCLNAQKGDKVLIRECRPLSKTKNFVIIKILGKDIEFLEKEEGMEEAKIKKKKSEVKEEKSGSAEDKTGGVEI